MMTKPSVFVVNDYRLYTPFFVCFAFCFIIVSTRSTTIRWILISRLSSEPDRTFLYFFNPTIFSLSAKLQCVCVITAPSPYRDGYNLIFLAIGANIIPEFERRAETH